MKRGEEKKKRRRRREGEEEEEEEGKEDFRYGLLWFCMDLYGIDSWILDLVLCLGFCYEKF